MKTSSLRATLAAILATLTLSAAAQTPSAPAPSQGTDEMPVFALLSLIGDKLDVVVKQAQTGSNINQNRRQPIPIDNPIFDSTAASAAGTAIRRAIPKAEFAILNTRSAPLFERQKILFDDQGDRLGVPEAILNAAKQQGANRLLLILKRRDDANFEFSVTGNFADAGKLEGLGFFVDASMETSTLDESSGNRTARGKGFISPFAFADVILLDVSSRKVLGRKGFTASTMVTSGQQGQDILEPWNAMSSADKVRHINRLIEREVTRTTLEIVASRKP